jgi:uncharacterized membrane protein YbhN (UPF0104 family)
MAPSWTTRLERHPLFLTLAAAAIAFGAASGMAYAAGLSNVLAQIERIEPAWLAVAVGARLASYVGYAVAHRRVMAACEHSELSSQMAARVVAFGAGATSLRGGFSIDVRAMRGSGASTEQARAHVAALALLEYAVLALGAWTCSLVLAGEPDVKGAAVWPWAIGVPAGAVLASLALPRLRERARAGRSGRRVRGLVDGVEILAHEWRRPARAATAALGMALYWAAEAGALWASLRAFGISCSPAVAILGLATAYILTPRGLPLAGAGIAEVLLPVSLMWLGVPLAAAVPAALASELVRLAVSLPPAVMAAEEVHRLVGRGRRARNAARERRRAAAAGGR